MKNEDEHPLERVEDAKEIRQDGRVFVDPNDAESPSDAEQEKQNGCAAHGRPASRAGQ